MSDFNVDTVIIGAGVVGLAIGLELLKENKDVLLLNLRMILARLLVLEILE